MSTIFTIIIKLSDKSRVFKLLAACERENPIRLGRAIRRKIIFTVGNGELLTMARHLECSCIQLVFSFPVPVIIFEWKLCRWWGFDLKVNFHAPLPLTQQTLCYKCGGASCRDVRRLHPGVCQGKSHCPVLIPTRRSLDLAPAGVAFPI